MAAPRLVALGSLLAILVVGASAKEKFRCPAFTKLTDEEHVFSDEEQCDIYWTCRGGESKRSLCPDGLVFHPDKPKGEDPCDLPHNVPDKCKKRPGLQRPQPGDAHCPRQNGVYPSEEPSECDVFYSCLNGVGSATKCADGLHFSEEIGTCVWARESGRTGCSSQQQKPKKSKDKKSDATTEANTTQKPKTLENGFTCPGGALGVHPALPHPTSCRHYYICLDGVTATPAGCRKGMVFNPDTQQCDSPANVVGCEDFYDEKAKKKKAEIAETLGADVNDKDFSKFLTLLKMSGVLNPESAGGLPAGGALGGGVGPVGNRPPGRHGRPGRRKGGQRPKRPLFGGPRRRPRPLKRPDYQEYLDDYYYYEDDYKDEDLDEEEDDIVEPVNTIAAKQAVVDETPRSDGPVERPSFPSRRNKFTALIPRVKNVGNTENIHPAGFEDSPPARPSVFKKKSETARPQPLDQPDANEEQSQLPARPAVPQPRKISSAKEENDKLLSLSGEDAGKLFESLLGKDQIAGTEEPAPVTPEVAPFVQATPVRVGPLAATRPKSRSELFNQNKPTGPTVLTNLDLALDVAPDVATSSQPEIEEEEDLSNEVEASTESASLLVTPLRRKSILGGGKRFRPRFRGRVQSTVEEPEEEEEIPEEIEDVVTDQSVEEEPEITTRTSGRRLVRPRPFAINSNRDKTEDRSSSVRGFRGRERGRESEAKQEEDEVEELEEIETEAPRTRENVIDRRSKFKLRRPSLLRPHLTRGDSQSEEEEASNEVLTEDEESEATERTATRISTSPRKSLRPRLFGRGRITTINNNDPSDEVSEEEDLAHVEAAEIADDIADPVDGLMKTVTLSGFQTATTPSPSLITTERTGGGSLFLFPITPAVPGLPASTTLPPVRSSTNIPPPPAVANNNNPFSKLMEQAVQAVPTPTPLPAEAPRSPVAISRFAATTAVPRASPEPAVVPERNTPAAAPLQPFTAFQSLQPVTPAATDESSAEDSGRSIFRNIPRQPIRTAAAVPRAEPEVTFARQPSVSSNPAPVSRQPVRTANTLSRGRTPLNSLSVPRGGDHDSVATTPAPFFAPEPSTAARPSQPVPFTAFGRFPSSSSPLAAQPAASQPQSSQPQANAPSGQSSFFAPFPARSVQPATAAAPANSFFPNSAPTQLSPANTFSQPAAASQASFPSSPFTNRFAVNSQPSPAGGSSSIQNPAQASPSLSFGLSSPGFSLSQRAPAGRSFGAGFQQSTSFGSNTDSRTQSVFLPPATTDPFQGFTNRLVPAPAVSQTREPVGQPLLSTGAAQPATGVFRTEPTAVGGTAAAVSRPSLLQPLAQVDEVSLENIRRMVSARVRSQLTSVLNAEAENEGDAIEILRERIKSSQNRNRARG